MFCIYFMVFENNNKLSICWFYVSLIFTVVVRCTVLLQYWKIQTRQIERHTETVKWLSRSFNLNGWEKKENIFVVRIILQHWPVTIENVWRMRILANIIPVYYMKSIGEIEEIILYRLRIVMEFRTDVRAH